MTSRETAAYKTKLRLTSIKYRERLNCAEHASRANFQSVFIKSAIECWQRGCVKINRLVKILTPFADTPHTKCHYQYRLQSSSGLHMREA